MFWSDAIGNNLCTKSFICELPLADISCLYESLVVFLWVECPGCRRFLGASSLNFSPFGSTSPFNFANCADHIAKDMGQNEHVEQGEIRLQHFDELCVYAKCR